MMLNLLAQPTRRMGRFFKANEGNNILERSQLTRVAVNTRARHGARLIYLLVCGASEKEGKSAPKSLDLPPDRCLCTSIPPSGLNGSRSISTKMPGEVAVLRFVKLTENAHPPSKGSELAAGYDLKSAYDYTIPARGKELVKTDIQVQLPDGCYGRIAPRSGIAWKHHIDVGAGVIDADYTGNLGIVMFNHGPEDFKVKAGDRVAQLICEKICYPDIQEVKVVAETPRGAGGFGSTGRS